MKNLLLPLICLFSLVLFFSCNDNDEDVVLQLNTQSLKVENLLNAKLYNSSKQEMSSNDIRAEWESQLESEGLKVTLENFEIIESYDDETGKDYYFLKAYSSDNSVQTGAFLEYSNDGKILYGEQNCSCLGGCGYGCNLKIVGNTCYCTDCWSNDVENPDNARCVLFQPPNELEPSR